MSVKDLFVEGENTNLYLTQLNIFPKDTSRATGISIYVCVCMRAGKSKEETEIKAAHRDLFFLREA